MGIERDKRRKILVVDDEAEIRKLIFDILNYLGYQTILAANGIEALEILCREKIELVISDINMPQMNGIELLQAIKKHYPGLLVIIISGFSISERDKIFIEALADASLTKPFNIEQLKTLLTDLLTKEG